MNKKKPEDFLDEEEKQLLYRFNQEPKLKEIIKRFLYDAIVLQGVVSDRKGYDPNHNWVFGILNSRTEDSEIGREVKMVAQALSTVQNAFRQLEGVVEDKKEEKSKINQAR